MSGLKFVVWLPVVNPWRKKLSVKNVPSPGFLPKKFPYIDPNFSNFGLTISGINSLCRSRADVEVVANDFDHFWSEYRGERYRPVK